MSHSAVRVKSPDAILRELGEGIVTNRNGSIPYDTFLSWVDGMRRSCRSENFSAYYVVAKNEGEDVLENWCSQFFAPRNIAKLEDMDDARQIFRAKMEQAAKSGKLSGISPQITGKVYRRPGITVTETKGGQPFQKEIKKILRYVTPAGLSPFDVDVLNVTGSASGADCTCNVNFSTSRAKLEIRVADNIYSKPVVIHEDVAEHLPVIVFTFTEALVYLIAHGVRHVWQSKHASGRRLWRTKGRFSEKDACAYGIHMLRCWRRGENRNGRQTRAVVSRRTRLQRLRGAE